jgi:tRNA pseudouridine55 synthase
MNGILVINKEKDYTSRDVVNILNKKFMTKKIGHTGTLDPMATGVLVVCLGKYTKLVDKITCYDKEYIATIKLGILTDTLDITGNVIKKNDKKIVDNQVLINTLNSFLGPSIQEVPIYSAVKVNGKKLYEYARSGEQVVLPKIEIKEIELLENKNGEITFRTIVSKGTYIRSLIRDICDSLGVLGVMSSLIRTRQGNFKISDAYKLKEIENDNYKLLKIEDIFSYQHYELSDDEYKKVSNGAFLKINLNDEYLFMEYKKEIIAIYKKYNDVFKTFFRL